MIDYNEINDFINKVFNYYNGRINIINKAVLDINWANLMSCDTCGYSNMPNNVIINPMVIIRFYNNDEYNSKAAIIETMIHELYHIDQVVNYNLYTTDFSYNELIERECQLQTVIYIADHIKEIYNTFGILFDINYYSIMIGYWYHEGVCYKRRYFTDHLFMYLGIICGSCDEFWQQLYESINNAILNNKNITLNINNNVLHIFINGIAMGIDEFNKNVYAFSQCSNNFNFDVEFATDEDGNVSIKTTIINKPIMCDKIMCIIK